MAILLAFYQFKAMKRLIKIKLGLVFISISKPSNNKLRNDPSENEERFKVRLSGFASSACEEYKFN